MSDGVEVGWFLGEVAIDCGEFAKAIGMHEQAVANVEEVVATGAFNGPVGAKEFARLEDFLADDPCFGSAFAEAREVLKRIAEAVGMVDAYAVEYAPIEPIENAPVGSVEDMRSLDANANQSVDVEEATVAELLIGGAPVGEPVVLLVQNFVEGIVVGVEFGNDMVDGS